MCPDLLGVFNVALLSSLGCLYAEPHIEKKTSKRAGVCIDAHYPG